ncbi:E3 ubiquitin-protein ligase pdzrn3, partial [Cichlidogyrus casuarinus]
VNGVDVSNATHEETVQTFENASEPIMVQVSRRSTDRQIFALSTPRKNSPCPTGNRQLFDSATQTDLDMMTLNSIFYSFQVQHQQQEEKEDFLENENFSDVYHLDRSFLLDVKAKKQQPIYANTPLGSSFVPEGCPFTGLHRYSVTIKRTDQRQRFGLNIIYKTLAGHVLPDQNTNDEHPILAFVSEVDQQQEGEMKEDCQIQAGDRLVEINRIPVFTKGQVIDALRSDSNSLQLTLESCSETENLGRSKNSRLVIHSNTSGTDKSSRSEVR